jgi:Rrf2 family protein
MIFSKTCEYGTRAVIYIAQQTKNDIRTSLKDISEQIGSPEAFTAKILQQLVKHDILISSKGAAGGFAVDKKKLKRIKLMHIVFAIDGSEYRDMCVLGLKKCSTKDPCPVHHKFKHVKKDLLSMLNNTTLDELTNKMNTGKSFLKLD